MVCPFPLYISIIEICPNQITMKNAEGATFSKWVNPRLIIQLPCNDCFYWQKGKMRRKGDRNHSTQKCQPHVIILLYGSFMVVFFGSIYYSNETSRFSTKIGIHGKLRTSHISLLHEGHNTKYIVIEIITKLYISFSLSYLVFKDCQSFLKTLLVYCIFLFSIHHLEFHIVKVNDS